MPLKLSEKTWKTLTSATDPKMLSFISWWDKSFLVRYTLPQTEICMKNDYQCQSRLVFWPGLMLIQHNLGS